MQRGCQQVFLLVLTRSVFIEVYSGLPRQATKDNDVGAGVAVRAVGAVRADGGFAGSIQALDSRQVESELVVT